MKNYLPLFSVLASLFLLFSGPGLAQDPGTAADPLVTKSYLDQFFRFRSMVVPGGEKISLVPGALLVLRSGRLKLRSPHKKGLVDLTSGSELAPDSFVPPNHLLLVPDSADYTLEAQTISLLLVQGMLPRK